MKKVLKRRLRRFTQPLEGVFLHLIAFVLRRLPMGIAVRLGGFAGLAAFSLFRIRRRVCLKNLEIAFPDLSLHQKIRIGKRSYANLGRSFVEFFLLDKITPDHIQRYVKINGADHAKAVFKDNKSFIAVTGHFGSWEIAAVAFRALGYPLDAVAVVQKNRTADRLFNSFRHKQGIGVIPKGQAPKGILRSLKRKHIVAILGDQEARSTGVEVEFFNFPAQTHQGAALFSLRYGAPIICPFIIRQGKSLFHEMTIEPPLEFKPTGKMDQDVKALTQAHVKRLEAWIRQYPDHWFWGHKRWRSKGVYDFL